MMLVGTAPNDVVRAANEFFGAYKAWAEAWNRKEPETVSLEEVKAWERLPDLWRKLERIRREWLR
jgi:hypothetical protein